MKYFRIKDWQKFSHRDHKKNQLWVKWHQDLLDDPRFFQLSTYQFGVYAKLVLLQARVGSYLEANQSYLKLKLNLTKPVDLALFESLGLIEEFSPHSERAQSAPRPHLELKIEKKIRREKKAKVQKKPINLEKTSEFIKSYCDVFKARYGFFPDVGKKNAGIAKRIVAEVGLENAKARVQNYLKMNNPWFLKRHHDLATLESNLNAIKMQEITGKSLTDNNIKQFTRRVENYEAMQRAMAKVKADES